MYDKEQKLTSFKELSTDEKKEKLLKIFEFIKEKIDFSENAINFLSNTDNPDEEVMIQLYELILSATGFAQQRKKTEDQQSQERQLEQMKQLHQQEKDSQNAEDSSAEDLLNLIEIM